MAHRRSRRDLICEAALDLAAEGGNHALTHQAIDARLGLARGSTSYYYRTRAAPGARPWSSPGRGRLPSGRSGVAAPARALG